MSSPRQPTEPAPTSPPPLYIVAVGASAGGLEALEALFRSAPTDLPAAYVVQQHLSPDFESHMDELLARHTAMRVVEASHGARLEPATVYLAPASKRMVVTNHQVVLAERVRSEPIGLPIDHLFRSIAQDAGDHAIGIVLSGTGSDGSRGVAAIKQAGGLVIAQEPASAAFDGMPTSAIATGVCDLILEPCDMGAELHRYLSAGARSARSGRGRDRDGARSDDDVVVPILRALRSAYGIDFSLYKPSTVLRRIQRRIDMSAETDIDGYAERLLADPDELAALYRDLLIGVTNFFRDEAAFEALKARAIAPLLASARLDEIRVWVAGCATGEEAYSLAIALDEMLSETPHAPTFKVFATDVDRRALQIAGAGWYPDEAFAKVSPERVRRYFRREGDGYRVNKQLRNTIVFANHNLIADAPFTRLHLVSCRNLLIYLQPVAQKKALALFHFGLQVDGILFLGSSETPGELHDEFDEIDGRLRIYRKRRDVRIPTDGRLGVSGQATGTRRRPSRVASQSRGANAALLGIYDDLLARYMPPSVLVDEDFQVLHVFSGAERFLRVPSGRPNSNVLELVHPELKAPLSSALQRVDRERKEVRYVGLDLGRGDDRRSVELRVSPAGSGAAAQTRFLVVIEDRRDAGGDREPEREHIDTDVLSQQHIGTLETELRYTKENLQATIEELETSNEELQATNEELVASNEELQSTNEELQSVNEELHSVNAELQRKIEQLTELTNDMDSLLQALEVGVLFLDDEMRIRKFNEAIASVFHLLPSDLGRPFDHFAHSIVGVTISDVVREVRASGSRSEREVALTNGRRQLLQVRSVASAGGPAGVLLTLIDIERLRSAEADNDRLSLIVESSHEAIVGVSLDGTILTWNGGAEALFELPRDRAEGESISIIVPADRAHETTEMLSAIRAGDSVERQTQRLRRSSGLVDVGISAFPVRDGAGVTTGGAIIARDIGERLRADRALRASIEHRDQFMATLSHELRNPLMGLLAAAELMEGEGGATDGAAATASGVIARQSRHMARILDDLLDITRLQRGGMHVKLQRVDLRSVIEPALEEVTTATEERCQSIRVSSPDEPVRVRADASRLVQLLANLLTNASKYSPEGAEIDVSLDSGAGCATLAVRDPGRGMPSEALERVFEPFVRFDDDDPHATSSLGLGLSVVRAIASAHGGRVTAESEGVGCGSRFVVELPLAAEDQPARRRRPKPAPTSSLRVLVVEDQDDNRELLELILGQSGHEVVAAGSAEAGLAMFERQQPFHAALIDIGLPDDSGCEVARGILERVNGRRPRLIALTGHGRQTDRDAILGAGFDTHLIKPISTPELLRALAQATDDAEA